MSVKLSFLTVFGFHVRWPVLLIFKTKIHVILRKIAARKIVDSEKRLLISRFLLPLFSYHFDPSSPTPQNTLQSSLAGMQDHLSVQPVSSLRLKFPRQLLQQKETRKRSNATKNASYLLVGTQTIGVWNHYVSVILFIHSKYTISFYTVQCAPGTYSGNGVEPCSPCPFGTYQPGSGQIACLPCPGQQSTHGTGASSIDFCGGNTSYCFFLILKPKGTWCLLSTVYFELNITGKIIFLLK